MTEKEIIQGCKKLNAQCQRALVKTFSGRLYTTCRRYCGDDSLSEEALQEGLIRIFKYIDKYDPKKGSFVAWMKRIVTNESLKLLRKRGAVYYVDLNDLELPALSVNALDNLHEEEMIKMIQELPSGYREVFNMYVIDGYSHKEIAKTLGITDSTSRSQLTRAKKLLQQKISMIENLQLWRKNA